MFKLKNLVRIDNLQFAQNYLSDFLQNNFLNYFTKTTKQHDHDTRGIRLNLQIVNTTYYCSNSITLKVIREWNSLQTKLNQNSLLEDKNIHKILQFFEAEILDSYL